MKEDYRMASIMAPVDMKIFMAIFMLVIGFWENARDKANMSGMQERSIKEIGTTINEMDMVCIIGQMVTITLGLGDMINVMDRVRRFGRMVIIMRESG